MALSSDVASVMIVNHMPFLINVNTCKNFPQIYKNTKIGMWLTFLGEDEVSEIYSVQYLALKYVVRRSHPEECFESVALILLTNGMPSTLLSLNVISSVSEVHQVQSARHEQGSGPGDERRHREMLHNHRYVVLGGEELSKWKLHHHCCPITKTQNRAKAK